MSFEIKPATRRSDHGTKRARLYNNGLPRKSKYGTARLVRNELEWCRWMAMLSRCYNQNASNFQRYGGRGIFVCDKWKNSYLEFLKDVGRSPSPQHTLDRIDNMGHYEPGNVRWATKSEQQNNRRQNVKFTHRGVTLTITQWARCHHLNVNTLKNRIKTGWDIDEAFQTKPSFHNKKHWGKVEL